MDRYLYVEKSNLSHLCSDKNIKNYTYFKLNYVWLKFIHIVGIWVTYNFKILFQLNLRRNLCTNQLILTNINILELTIGTNISIVNSKILITLRDIS